MRMSDSKLLSFASGEIPIPGDSQRSLGRTPALPVLPLHLHLLLHSLISAPPLTELHQIRRKEQAADGAAHASHQASAALDHRPVAQAKAAAKSESFSFVCAWKDIPEIQQLFAACAASHTGGFQVQRGQIASCCLCLKLFAVTVSAHEATGCRSDSRAVDAVLQGVLPQFSFELEQLRAAAQLL
jgi:hypothetical protein